MRLLFLVACTAPSGDKTVGVDSTTDLTDSDSTTSDTTPPDTSPTDSTPTETGTTISSPPTNVLLVSIDTLRGDRWEMMPELAARDAGGVVLDHFWTHSWTYLGMGTVLTGQAASTWGPESHAVSDGTFPFLDPAIPTLAEALSAAGLASTLITGGYLVGEETGLDRGYDTFVNITGEPADVVADAGVAWVAAQTGPWFAHLHVMEPHSPYDEVAESCSADVEAVADNGCRYDLVTEVVIERINDDLRNGAFGPGSDDYDACIEQLEARYDCGVKALDDALAQSLWGPLETAGLLDDALVVVVNDHGEGMIDPWASHRGDSRAPVTRGRASFRSPGRLAPTVVSAPTGQDDIGPSILGILGIEAGMATTGAPYWEASETRVVETFFCGIEFDGTIGRVHGVVGEGYHLLYKSNAEPSLYAVEDDPQENDDLYGTVAVPPAVEAAAVAQEAATTAYCSGLGP